MLYNLDWLQQGKPFPPAVELNRIRRYKENERLFENDHFDGHNNIYEQCASRISKVVGNFLDITSFPVIFNYQRLISTKTADLVCGESPTITGASTQVSDDIKTMREEVDFDAQLFSTVLDLSRYGDAIWRVFKDEITGKGTFTVWTPKSWFPIVMNDGTLRIKQHVLAWVSNVGTDEIPIWRLNVQIHKVGSYEARTYDMDNAGSMIGVQIGNPSTVATGLSTNAIMSLRNMRTTSSIYGYDDYIPVDSIIAEIMTRVGQISAILDKHADPCLTGPGSMLTTDFKTGEKYLKKGQFYAVSPGEDSPQYLVWDGQLEAAFKELTLLFDQLYILSELGTALIGVAEKTGQAISGTAMRFKMVNPLVKARRITNSMTIPTKQLLSAISQIGRSKIEAGELSIKWKDGLPDDPKEVAELIKLETGATQFIPLVTSLIDHLELTSEEADEYVEKLAKEQKAKADAIASTDPPNQGGKLVEKIEPVGKKPNTQLKV